MRPLSSRDLPALQNCKGAAHLSSDGLTLLYGALREGGLGDQDIWMRKRLATDEPFGEPVNVMDGYLYVGSLDTDSVLRFDAGSGILHDQFVAPGAGVAAREGSRTGIPAWLPA